MILLELLSCALMVGAAIYMGHQGFTLRRINREIEDIVRKLNDDKPWERPKDV